MSCAPSGPKPGGFRFVAPHVRRRTSPPDKAPPRHLGRYNAGVRAARNPSPSVQIAANLLRDLPYKTPGISLDLLPQMYREHIRGLPRLSVIRGHGTIQQVK